MNQADNDATQTNGHSWCLFPYSVLAHDLHHTHLTIHYSLTHTPSYFLASLQDATPGFAPSLATMLAAAGGSADKARELFCGLEAVVTSASGEKLTLYIADAFDDTWVRTPSSIDVIHPFFNTLYGKATNDKDDVLKKVSSGGFVLHGSVGMKEKKRADVMLMLGRPSGSLREGVTRATPRVASATRNRCNLGSYVCRGRTHFFSFPS